MIKYIIVLTLVFGIGCYGGGSYQAEPFEVWSQYGEGWNPALDNPEPGRRYSELKTGLIYDVNTGESEWTIISPLHGGDGRRSSYMNYETGEIYRPLRGRGNYYIKPDGGLIKQY